MASITIFGQGNMGSAIGKLFENAGNAVSYIEAGDKGVNLGDIVVFAVPYPAVEGILSVYGDDLAGKILIDITNPVNFETFDDLVVPADSSASAQIANQLKETRVIKAFNTTFAATLASHKVADTVQTTVMMASDDAEAKAEVSQVLEGSGVCTLDAGSLKRARELEAFGFLQISLAAGEKISWTGGFAILD